MRLGIISEVFADLLASPFVVDADERRIVAIGNTRVDRDDGNAGFLRRGNRGLHPVDVNGDQHNAVHLLGDIVLDRAVLGRGDVVGVEDDELRARFIRCCLAPSLIWLKKSACWLIVTSATVAAFAGIAPSAAAANAKTLKPLTIDFI